jgi:hypothetical protein
VIGYVPSLTRTSECRGPKPEDIEERVLAWRAHYDAVGATQRTRAAPSTRMRAVIRTDAAGNERRFHCLREAAHEMGCSTTAIHTACNSDREFRGYRWRKVDRAN